MTEEQEAIKQKVKKIIDNISGLPTLPVVISQITKLMQNPKVSASEVGQAISEIITSN